MKDKYSAEEISNLLNMVDGATVRLDDFATIEEEDTYLNFVKSDYKENRYEKADELYLSKYNEILNILLKDTKVLKYKFSDNPLSLAEIGRIRGVTREAIRQEEEKELKHLLTILRINGYTKNPYTEVKENNNNFNLK